MNLRRFVESFLGRNAAPEAVAKLEARDPALITLISVIYSTAPQTFSGSAVYVTMTSSRPKPTSAEEEEDESTTTVRATSRAMVTPTSRPTTPGSSSAPSSIIPVSASSINTASPVAATTSSTADAEPASSGMSGGAKAGLAFGLIILFALIGGLIFFFIKKRKNNEQHQQLDDEKAFLQLGRKPDDLPAHATPTTMSSFGPIGPGAAGVGAGAAAGGFYGAGLSEKQAHNNSAEDRRRFSYEAEAPQLSLRAVSQFEPGLNNGSVAPPVTKPALAPIVAAGAGAAALGAVAAAGNNSSKGSLASDPNNPFGNHAEKLGSSPPQDVPLPASPTVAPRRLSPAPQAADFPLPDSAPGTPSNSTSPVLGKAEVATATTVGAAAIAAATAAAASNKPQVTATPASNASGPGENVHRVQLDFIPSMDDELKIKAGQLVRVLHEYDDGWALCTHMDRSRQGVVPRTCLSKHAVKPRPQSPARPGNGRAPAGRPNGPPPFAQSPRPLSPANGRNSPGPAAAPYAQSPRPLTPTNREGGNGPQYKPMRSQSPGPYGGSKLRPSETTPNKRRSNSMSTVGASSLKNESVQSSPPSKIPAPAGSIPSRKPVPGSS